VFTVGTSVVVNDWVWYIAGILVQAFLTQCSYLSENGSTK